MKPKHLDWRQACGRALTAFGPLLAFVAACMRGSVRGQVAGASSATVCPCTPSPPATVPQGGGGAPVLRPTLAGHHRGPPQTAASSPTKRANSQDTANGASDRGHHHRPAATSGGRPRVGPPPKCWGRWLGVRSEAPFAGSWLFVRLAGVDGASARGPHRVPRERGPENVPRATCPRAELAVRAATNVELRTSAKGRKQACTPHRSFMGRSPHSANGVPT